MGSESDVRHDQLQAQQNHPSPASGVGGRGRSPFLYIYILYIIYIIYIIYICVYIPLNPIKSFCKSRFASTNWTLSPTSRASLLPSHLRVSPKPQWIFVLGVMDAGILFIPAGNLRYSYGKSFLLHANHHKTSTNGQCSIAMLNKQRVTCKSIYSSGISHIQLKYILVVIPSDKWLRTYMLYPIFLRACVMWLK